VNQGLAFGLASFARAAGTAIAAAASGAAASGAVAQATSETVPRAILAGSAWSR
jgi:hypothetical protein